MVLLDPMIFFFYAVGVWDIVLSGLRIVVEKNVKKALGDLFGCFFSFFCAFLLTKYAAMRSTEQINRSLLYHSHWYSSRQCNSFLGVQEQK